MRLVSTALAAAFTVAVLAAVSVALADSKSDKSDKSAAGTSVSGVLIDQACGAKMLKKDDPEKAAAGHPKSCATKEACEKSGYAVITGKKMLKFDANGDKLAKDFLAKTDKKDDLRVTVHGTEKGDEIEVTSITAEGAK